MSLSVYGFDSGDLRTAMTVLPNTATDVMSVALNPTTVVSITVSNISGVAVPVTLAVFDGVNTYQITHLSPVGAAGTVSAEGRDLSQYKYELPIRLQKNGVIRATAGTAAVLHCFVTYVLSPGRTT